MRSERDTRVLAPPPFGLEWHPIEGLPGGGVWGLYGGMTVITSVDDGALHLSVARMDRYPTWDEIHALRDWYFPADMEVVMVLPRQEEYVNLHPNCFHLWQSRCGEEGR